MAWCGDQSAERRTRHGELRFRHGELVPFGSVPTSTSAARSAIPRPTLIRQTEGGVVRMDDWQRRLAAPRHPTAFPHREVTAPTASRPYRSRGCDAAGKKRAGLTESMIQSREGPVKGELWL